MRALDLRAARADAREVVADAAAAAHGLGRFAQRFVDAGVAALVHALDAVAHGLHEAVDERGLDVGAGGAHDAARADGAGVQVGQEQRLVFLPLALGLDRGQRARHAPVQVFGAGLTGLEVFFFQHIEADGLGGGHVVRASEVFAFHGVCLGKGPRSTWPARPWKGLRSGPGEALRRCQE